MRDKTSYDNQAIINFFSKNPKQELKPIDIDTNQSIEFFDDDVFLVQYIGIDPETSFAKFNIITQISGKYRNLAVNRVTCYEGYNFVLYKSI